VLGILHAASEHATRSSLSGKNPTPLFELDVVEAPHVPTTDQLRSILEFVGSNNVGHIIKGARSEIEARKILIEGGKEASERVTRPLLVDWNNGRAGKILIFFYRWEMLTHSFCYSLWRGREGG
jgi:hypothetical protein